MIDPNQQIIYIIMSILMKEIKWYQHSGHVITIDKEKRKSLKMYINFRIIGMDRVKIKM